MVGIVVIVEGYFFIIINGVVIFYFLYYIQGVCVGFCEVGCSQFGQVEFCDLDKFESGGILQNVEICCSDIGEVLYCNINVYFFIKIRWIFWLFKVYCISYVLGLQ